MIISLLIDATIHLLTSQLFIHRSKITYLLTHSFFRIEILSIVLVMDKDNAHSEPQIDDVFNILLSVSARMLEVFKHPIENHFTGSHSCTIDQIIEILRVGKYANGACQTISLSRNRYF